MNRWRNACGAALVAGILAVAGCGGGNGVADGGAGGTGGTGGDGGVGGTGVVAARGPITAFGSVWVNGIHFDTSTAAVTVEGAAGTLGDLRLGMVVSVAGRENPDGSVAAETVDYADQVEGPIEAGSLTGGGFRVLGQQVLWTPPPGAPLAEGNVVEVSGLVDGDGVIHATYVEVKAESWREGEEIELKGVARDVAPAAGTFRINTLVVSYPGVSAALGGEWVEVTSTRGFDGDGLLVADKVETADGDRLPGDDGVTAEIEGFVTAVVSAAQFTLDETPVDAAGAAFEKGDPADLVVGARVEVEGTFRGGVLQARRIEFEGVGD